MEPDEMKKAWDSRMGDVLDLVAPKLKGIPQGVRKEFGPQPVRGAQFVPPEQERKGTPHVYEWILIHGDTLIGSGVLSWDGSLETFLLQLNVRGRLDAYNEQRAERHQEPVSLLDGTAVFRWREW